ncbi:MAG: hydrolase [Candidatus Saccharibacteria bacterium]|nr:hydrolase [Candidatus Saccharibacteria bacterium]
MWHPESGTKVILEDPQGRILACQRDNNPAIPFPDLWDFPGGGAEPGETLLQCGIRELEEEFGLIGVDIVMLDEIPSSETPGKIMGRAYGRLTARQVGSIVFGSEGQRFGFFTDHEIVELNFVPQLKNYVIAMRRRFNGVEALEQTA